MRRIGPRDLSQNNNRLKRVYVRQDGNVTFICPSCNRVSIVSVSKFKGQRHTIKIRCNCTKQFVTNLDFRQHYRKPTNITGKYILDHPARGEGEVIIRNISLGGISFEVLGAHFTKEGDTGTIDFVLDNKNKTPFERRFTVQSVNGQVVGCKFIKDREYDKELGFYMRFGT